MLAAGDRAPDFSLPGIDQAVYRLADLFGGCPSLLLVFLRHLG